MAARPDLDLAAGAEKGELDAALLTLLDRDLLLVLLEFSAILSWPIALLGANNSPFLSSLLFFLLTLVKSLNGTAGMFSVWTT
jgi:hypothetical protein